MTEKKFDISIPRKKYWSDEIGNRKSCPECNSKLEKEYHTYMILKKVRNKSEPFISGNDGGYFCPKCPTIVLDFNIFSSVISATDENASSFQFIVAGIINLDAIPPEKSDTPLGDDSNPIPLVEFIRDSNNRDYKKKHQITKNRSRKKRPKRKLT